MAFGAVVTAAMPDMTRDLLFSKRTGLSNVLRAHLAEYGIISSKDRAA